MLRPANARTIALIGLCASLLLGCSPQTENQQTLRVRVWSDWAYVTKAAQQYESEHEGVSIIVDGISSPDYFQSLPTLLDSSDSPDVTALQVIPGTYTDLVRSGLLENLSDVWKEQDLARAYRPATVARYTTDGSQYAISTALQWVPVVYTNLDAFAKAGVSMPTSHRPSVDWWNHAVGALKESGYVPVATYGISDEYGAAFILSSLLRSACGEDWYTNILVNWQSGTSQQSRWTDPCAVQAIEEIRGWADEGVFGQDPAGQSAETSLRMFLSGKAAMYVSGSWQTKSFEEDRPAFDLDWMLLPPVAGGIETNFMLADMDGLGVSSRSADPELAKDFLAYVSSREIQSQDWFLGSAGVSPRADVEFPASIDAMKADQFSNIQGVGSSGQLTVAVPYNPAIPKSLARMLAGELTPQAVAETLEGKVQAERARG